MSDKFRDKYRITSPRLQNWDCSSNGYYFITICAKNREHYFASLPNKFGPQSKNLASIIRGFKIGVKKYATLNNNDFAWQSRFYDHIVRDEPSLNRMREYIQNNPSNWNNDRNNSENLWI